MRRNTLEGTTSPPLFAEKSDLLRVESFFKGTTNGTAAERASLQPPFEFVRAL
jgi:hypothetical protein